jgi:hypothetical protein
MSASWNGGARRHAEGRARANLQARPALEDEAAWIERHRQLWAARFDALDTHVEELKLKEKADD